jgi:carbamate kinase
VEAVIDKDRVSALLAKHLEARVLIFSTGVDRVAVNFGKPNVRWLEEVGWKEMRRYFQAGEFAPGSMGPKVEAALGYLAYMQRRTPPDETCRAIITSPAFIGASLRGEAGTEVFGPGVDIQIFSRRQLSVA